jgi:signal peptidase I
MSNYLKKTLILVIVFAATYFAQPYRVVVVQGRSMSPTFADGQILVAKRLDHKPQVGDVVIMNRDGDTIIKRIARVPGDCIEEAYVPLMHRWIEIMTPATRSLVRRGVLACRVTRVPDGQVYVLGDNPDVSLDSRMFGTLPVASIRGFVVGS